MREPIIGAQPAIMRRVRISWRIVAPYGVVRHHHRAHAAEMDVSERAAVALPFII